MGDASNEPELTPLQQAALERIRFFQDELKKKGLYVRLACEQEFSVLYCGQPVMRPIFVKNTGDYQYRGTKYTDHQAIVDVLRKAGIENLHEFEVQTADPIYGAPMTCEAKFDDPEHFMVRDVHHAATPEQIIHSLVQFRKCGFQEILRSTTCLNQQTLDALDLSRLTMFVNPLGLGYSTSFGLHENTSIYDAAGNSLCDHAGFRHAYAARLLDLQYKAGLAYLQTPEGMKRIDRNSGTPKTISIGQGDQKVQGFTLLERSGSQGVYFENRLPGADADPYVTAALDLAAIYDTVNYYTDLRNMQTISREALDHVWPHPLLTRYAHDLDHRIEHDEHDGIRWVRRFEEHQELKQLLGDALYAGILKEYGKALTV